MGAIINTVLIIIGSVAGIILKKGIPQRISDTVQQGIAFFILVMGIDGAMTSQNAIIMIVSIAIGAFLGEALQIDQNINQAVYKLQDRFTQKEGSDQVNLADGLIAASSLFCVGSMVIIGSLENGLQGDPTTLITKGIIDGISAIFLAASYGWGVALSAIPVLVLEGGLTLFAGFLQPILPADVITEVVAVGSLLLIGLALNMMGITKFKVMNYMPAMLIPILIMPFL